MLVTLDVIMPGMDGWAVLGELKADPAISRIPAVLVTMRDDKQMGLGLDASATGGKGTRSARIAPNSAKP